jgi:IS605 OrfB family transposase
MILWECEHDPDAMPMIDSYSIITDFAGTPQCVIQTIDVQVKPFDQIDAQFAFAEGEDEPDPLDVDGTLGVDLGIVNLATDSDGETLSGERIERRRQWYATRRQALQKVGTRSAKRRLCLLKGRQRRFQQDTNHVISKRLVAKAKHTKRAIALEDLSGIRQRARVQRQQRARHSNWAFGQLRFFISYKARRAGVRVAFVDPAYTSQRCSACGHTERRNRKSQAAFCCVVCGHASSADYNAAINIEWAALSAGL